MESLRPLFSLLMSSSSLSVLSPSSSRFSAMLSSSRLFSNLQALSELSGSFFFYEPREHLRSGEPGSPLVWQSVSPNEEENLHWSCLDHYSLSLCSSLSGSLALSPEEAVSRISEKRLWQTMSLLWVPDYCQSGDYGGAVHYRSNANVLLGEFSSPQCRELYGSYGSHGVAIDPRYLSEELLENLQSLESYPVLDEDALSHLELELQGEAWESWARSDFSRKLEKLLCDLLSAHYEDGDDERAEQSIESLSEDQLWSLFSNAAEEANIYWESQHNDVWIDVERVAESLSEDQLLSLLLPSESLSRAS
jgi:hypothetical protein